jgi:hypothetical protein
LSEGRRDLAPKAIAADALLRVVMLPKHIRPTIQRHGFARKKAAAKEETLRKRTSKKKPETSWII